MNQETIFKYIRIEREDQDREYGERNADLEWDSNDLLAILAKQFGDVATMLKYAREQDDSESFKRELSIELVAVAAVATMWLEKITL